MTTLTSRENFLLSIASDRSERHVLSVVNCQSPVTHFNPAQQSLCTAHLSNSGTHAALDVWSLWIVSTIVTNVLVMFG
eukprot:CAMPEP_0172500200 /NCGR_PEP_ID=MMETSP1066-20121228/135685_1 /TAXON_ID=671091 /ORGANISM="Coscinodiscus wailesii, Strain CCMP2513" /LENGTH=77 /DNA_ID=CAMNT_0013274313 /DNA_START=173 /DNA_END=406 /DNA_ORIENTATION=+